MAVARNLTGFATCDEGAPLRHATRSRRTALPIVVLNISGAKVPLIEGLAAAQMRAEERGADKPHRTAYRRENHDDVDGHHVPICG
jgi:hypothetical protein